MDNSLLSTRPAIDHRFTLLARTICADQQIHSQELKALSSLAQQLNASEETLQAIQQVLEDNAQVSLAEAANAIPTQQRREAFRQVIAIAYSDGYFAPLERQFVEQLGEHWGISKPEIDHTLKAAQGLLLPDVGQANSLSAGARLLQGTESLLSRSLVEKFTALAPEHFAQRIEQLHREILLSGPQYDQAVQQCAKVAAEDFVYADAALRHTSSILRDLASGIQRAVATISNSQFGEKVARVGLMGVV
ncbi:MAG: TerB family tellurite resistance protein [Cyanobacteria bacterium P01_A01_bin.135]